MSTARKTVTVLFCDVTGSTALGEELDPESLREVIQRFFGEMLLGEPTYRLVRAAVIAEPLPEPLELKGKAEPLPAYRLVVVEAGAEILPRRFDSPLVGRERELAAIRDALADAVAASSCRV